MTKNKLVKIKSEKGFTIYDLIVAIIVFSMFATIIGTLIVTTYKVQATTEAEEVATLYVIQIVEYIDKIDFDEVTNELSQTLPQKFNIPEAFTVEIQATDYKPNENTQAYIKNVNVNLSYNFVGEQKNITIKRLKIKEL